MPFSKAKGKGAPEKQNSGSHKKGPKSKTHPDKSLLKVVNTIKIDPEDIGSARRVLRTKTGDIVVRPRFKLHKTSCTHVPSVPQKKVKEGASASSSSSSTKVKGAEDERYSKAVEKHDSTYYGGSGASSAEESTPMLIKGGSDGGGRDEDDEDEDSELAKKGH